METTLTMTSDTDVENLRKAVMAKKWQEILKVYEEKKEVRSAKIMTETGDTALHVAVNSGEKDVVKSMVKFVCGEQINEEGGSASLLLSMVEENGDEKNSVLGAQNDKGDTPLHLAAMKGSVDMCETISSEDRSLIAKRNKAGETPLFVAALNGHKKAFLCLHYQYIGSVGDSPAKEDIIQRDNQDTILHCALENMHIDVAIEIVLLYKDHLKKMTSMRNRQGLTPLHLLAERPSFFQSTDLSWQSYIVDRLFYNVTFVRVKKKEEATTSHELLQPDKKSLGDHITDFGHYIQEYCWSWVIWVYMLIIVFLLVLYTFLVLIMFFPSIAEILFVEALHIKEKHTWSLQIVEELLKHASDKDMSTDPYKEDNEEESKIVDTPLMIATRNGVTEMVDKILEYFPSTINIVNEEGKNIVQIAVEKRQTKVYQILCQHQNVAESAFRHMDKEKNTALHLVAKPRVNLNWQTTTMIEEFKWFEYVKKKMPADLLGKYNDEKKTTEEIFRKSFKHHIKSDREWLNQTSQTSSVASTIVASMAFSSIVANNNGENYSTIAALSLSLASTICFLAILAFRSQSINFWRYTPLMLQLGIFFMFGSIVALWISLMFNGKALIAYSIFGWPIAIFTIVSLPIFIGPTLTSMFSEVPPPVHNVTSVSATRYRKPPQ